MLLNRYLASNRNMPAVFQKVVEGAPPDKFNVDHLKAIGFGGSNDRAIVPLLKELDFLTADGSPTQRYRDYRDKSRSKSIMAEALREKYSDLFSISEKISKSDKEAVVGRFKAVHGVTDDIASRMAATFFALLDLADLSASQPASEKILSDVKEINLNSANVKHTSQVENKIQFAYNIQIQLPAVKDIEIYNAIFKSIRSNLMEN